MSSSHSVTVVQKADRFQRLMGGTTDDGNEDGITRPENVGFEENVEIEQLIFAEDQPLPVDGPNGSGEIGD